MINYKIIVNNGKNIPVNIKKVTPNDPDFRKTVFERSLRSCYWRPGMRVKLRGTSRLGTVMEVIKDIDQINWTNNRPNYLAIAFDDGKYELGNPCQLKGTKK